MSLKKNKYAVLKNVISYKSQKYKLFTDLFHYLFGYML